MTRLLTVCMVLFPAWLEAQVPRAALQYRRALTQEMRLVWGMDAPIATVAGQLHQESGWRADAKSPYAGGLSQFTPATAEWLAKAYPEVGKAAPFEPAWALRAVARYDKHLYDRISGAETECERWAFTLSGYNGGAGWVTRQRAATAKAGRNPNRWFGSVEDVRVRAEWAHKENRGYPDRILRKLQPIYVTALWGRGVTCAGVA